MGLLKSFVCALLSLSCAADKPHGASSPAPPLAAERPSVDQVAPSRPIGGAMGAEQTLRPLAVPGFEPALLFTPAGTSQRPLVMAAHGAGGGPDWECEYWRRLTRGRAFILCISGTPIGGSYSGFFFRDHRALHRELLAAERAARDAEPRILAGSGIYAGFSQGATMGTAILAQRAAAFPYAVLIEGFMPWNVPGARRFVREGGRRVLFACGSKECEAVAKTSVRWFQTAHVEARLEYAPGQGHTPAGRVMAQVESALPWLLQDDPHWLAAD